MATLLGGGGNGGASAYIATLLHGVTMAHMHHLMASSYAKHMALGDLYDDLNDKTDALAEAYMGCTGQKLTFTGGSVTLAADPIADVQALYEYAERQRAAMGDESHVQNIVDEVCSVIASALYKLRRLS